MKKGSLRGLSPERILVIQLKQVGDVILCTPALRALRKAYPDSRLDFLCQASAGKALVGNPRIDNLIILDGRDDLLEKGKKISKLRSARYDLVIDYLATPATAVITKLCGAKASVSYAGQKRSRFYSHAVEPQGNYSAQHKLSLLRILGIEDGELKPEFYVSEGAKEKISKWLHSRKLEPKKFCVIDATHRRETRRYTRYDEVADLMWKEEGLPSVFVWGPGEKEFVGNILTKAGKEHFLAPPTTLDELGALLLFSAILIGNDSAPRHIASALDVPTVIPTGSTRSENWTLPSQIHKAVYLDIECRPCSSNKCNWETIKCMTMLEPSVVVNAGRELIRG